MIGNGFDYSKRLAFSDTIYGITFDEDFEWQSSESSESSKPILCRSNWVVVLLLPAMLFFC
jgi:hypothetical protein